MRSGLCILTCIGTCLGARTAQRAELICRAAAAAAEKNLKGKSESSLGASRAGSPGICRHMHQCMRVSLSAWTCVCASAFICARPAVGGCEGV